MPFPQGLDTPVGERGVSLSGGQRQRLALARAIVAEPAVLLLDDCTSALDAETEARIQQALDRHLPGRTCVIVSHKVSSVRRCDLIVVLEDGRIIEQGTHEQLLSRHGHYAATYAQQTRALVLGSGRMKPCLRLGSKGGISSYTVTCCVRFRVGVRSYPMQIVGKVAATMQKVYGPQLNELGQTTGAIQRVRKFTGTSLLQMLVLTLLRKPNAKIADIQLRPHNWGSTSRRRLSNSGSDSSLCLPPLGAGADRAPGHGGGVSAVDLLKQFTSIRIGDSSTLAVPEELADQFPGCGGKSGSGQAR